MATKKTYLMPQAMRRGQPSIIAAVRETDGPKVGYWLAVWTDLMGIETLGTKPPYKGIGKEYGCASRTRISESFYKALLAESRKQAEEFMALQRRRLGK